MTPNMLNTYVAKGTEDIYLKYAAKPPKREMHELFALPLFECIFPEKEEAPNKKALCGRRNNKPSREQICSRLVL